MKIDANNYTRDRDIAISGYRQVEVLPYSKISIMDTLALFWLTSSVRHFDG